MGGTDVGDDGNDVEATLEEMISVGGVDLMVGGIGVGVGVVGVGGGGGGVVTIMVDGGGGGGACVVLVVGNGGGGVEVEVGGLELDAVPQINGESLTLTPSW
jgi:hypothetical protein